jgi:hypothetical protein
VRTPPRRTLSLTPSTPLNFDLDVEYPDPDDDETNTTTAFTTAATAAATTTAAPKAPLEAAPVANAGTGAAGEVDDDAHSAFRALAAMLSDRRCALRIVDLSGEPHAHAVADEMPKLLIALGRCRSLTSADVSGHSCGRQPGALGALLQLLRRHRGLSRLVLHSNAFDAASMRTLLGCWRRRNLTLLRLQLFASDPRDERRARNALADEASVGSLKLARELTEEGEQIASRNMRLVEALAEAGGELMSMAAHE